MSRQRCRDRVDLVALVLEQAGDDLLQRPLAVGELHLARGRHRVDLLIAEQLDRCERIPRGRETGE